MKQIPLLKLVTLFLSLTFSHFSFADSKQLADRFNHDVVTNLAKDLASKPYEPLTTAPQSLLNMDYSTYRLINFQQHAAVWGKAATPFSIQLFAPGYIYKDVVDIDIVENGVARTLEVTSDSFRVPEPEIGKILADISKYAGFRLHYPLNNKAHADEFVVFQGASYFRAVSKGQTYGVSTRGLALDVGEQHGEEFPTFKHFWIERASKSQHSIVVHALLDSPSVSGAYRFGIYPDDPTRMDVSVTLFPRKALHHVGIAPLTSMFMYNELVKSRMADYRVAVHDSEALAITQNNDEHLWRPLNNPRSLQLSAFNDTDPKGFGLIQRHRALTDYQDLEAHYQSRPSVWVTPRGDWGKGHVQLVEIPSNEESNDNIVAYWRPHEVLKPNQSYHYQYQLSWPDDRPEKNVLARVVRSAFGNKLFGEGKELVIDFADIDPELIENLTIEAGTNNGQIVESHLQHNPNIEGVRLFVNFELNNADPAEVRLRLLNDNVAITETWLFRVVNEDLMQPTN
jgi:glucans biosynthesis protein